MKIPEVAIGAVLHDGKLTACVRRNTTLLEAAEHIVADTSVAAWVLLDMKEAMRHEAPSVFLDGSAATGHVLEVIQQHDPQGDNRIIHGLGVPTALSPGGVEFADRRSELFYGFARAVHRGTILVPPDEELAQQLLAFEEGERNGAIAYPSPADVKARIGRFPARALAAALASIPAPPPGAFKKPNRRLSWDPYK